MTDDADNQERPDAKPRMERSRKGKQLGDYEVGYGRPPVGSRFTSSGNPKGRPPGSRSLGPLVREALDAKLKVREGGRDRKMSKREIGAIKIANRFAETADDKTAALIMKLEMADHAPRNSLIEPTPVAETVEDQTRRRAILDWFAQRSREAEAPPSGTEGDEGGGDDR